MKTKETPKNSTPLGEVKLSDQSHESTSETPPATSIRFECSVPELAWIFSVGERRIAELRSQGVVVATRRGRLNGTESVRNYLRHLRKESEQKAGSAERLSLVQERTLKVRADRELAEVKLAKERGELVSAVSVRESGLKIGALLTARLGQMVADAAGALAGLSEQELHTRLSDRVNAALIGFKDDLSKV